ncbi:MAG: PLDc N-terminal domain-containing protein [Candidatus Aenigmatarchaeota archaeon]
MSLFSTIIDKIGVYFFSGLVIIAILTIGFWIWSLIDCFKNKKKSKLFWLLAIILLFFIGSMLYVIIEKKKVNRKKEIKLINK